MSGFVLRQSVPSSGHCFVLSTAAAASIRVMRRLNPDSRSCIADVPDPLRVAPRSMTGWECICFLRASGFEWRKAPKVAKRAALEPLTWELVTEQGKRYWYSTAVQVNLSYLQCLVLAQSGSLFAEGGVQMIRHVQLLEYYQKLLQEPPSIDGTVPLMDTSRRSRMTSKMPRPQRLEDDTHPQGIQGDAALIDGDAEQQAHDDVTLFKKLFNEEMGGAAGADDGGDESDQGDRKSDGDKASDLTNIIVPTPRRWHA